MTLCVVLTFAWMAALSYKCGWWWWWWWGDLFPYTPPGLPWGLPCHSAHICELYGPLMKLPFSSPSAMNVILEANVCVSLPLILWLLFLFAAFAVTANGQVECSKGFKRMNLTHCQGKLYVHECVSSSVLVCALHLAPIGIRSRLQLALVQGQSSVAN